MTVATIAQRLRDDHDVARWVGVDGASLHCNYFRRRGGLGSK